MRVINLDDTGIKLISSNKKQIYLSLNEIKEFVAKKYIIKENLLTFYEKRLQLSDNDVKEFPNILEYIKDNFVK